jgi:hypothetical protein
MPKKQKQTHVTVVEMSTADDDADEEYGNCVKKMRIGSNTNTNYRSGLKKIIEYFQNSPKWKSLVIPDEDNTIKFPYTLDIPVPLASLKACFGFYATKPMQKPRKRGKQKRKRGKQVRGKKKASRVVCIIDGSNSQDSERSGSDSDNDSEDSNDDSASNDRRNAIERYRNSGESVFSDNEVVPSFNDEMILNEKDDEFQDLKNMDQPTISFSGLSGYHRYNYYMSTTYRLSFLLNMCSFCCFVVP